MKAAKIIAAVAFVALAVAAVEGGNRGAICGGRFVHQQVQAPVYAAPVVAAPVYQYQVGQHIRDEAIAERVAELVLERLAVKSQSSPRPESQESENEGSGEEDAELLDVAQSIANSRCTNCHRHNGSDEKGIDLRRLHELSSLQGWEVFRQVYLGTMPKGGEPIPDEEVEALMRWNIYR